MLERGIPPDHSQLPTPRCETASKRAESPTELLIFTSKATAENPMDFL